MKIVIQTLIVIAAFFQTDTPAQECGKLSPFRYSPDVLSGEMRSSIVFSPNGKTALIEEFSSFDPQTNKYSILISLLKNGNWTKPEVADFSGIYSDAKPFFAPDGRKVFFASKRPVEGKEKTDFDLWFVERRGKSWGAPQHLGKKINSEADDYAPSVTKQGTLYFSSSRDGIGRFDLYRSSYKNGNYQTPQILNDSINTPMIENLPYISVDEKFLIFEASGWKENIGGTAGDLYLSCFQKGNWAKPLNLGEEVNSPKSDRSAFYSASDGSLYFASNRNSSELAFFRVDFKKFVRCVCN